MHARPNERNGGAALVIALCMLVAVLIVSVATAQTALHAEQAARGERDRHVALQAAEAALADAEADIDGGADPGSPRAAMFSAGGALGFVEGCAGAGPTQGLCLPSADPAAPPVWQSVDLADPRTSVAYGQFTGKAMRTGAPALPARPPRYIIERIALAVAGEDAGAIPRGYRITAIGFGVRATSRVVLQSCYRKPDARPAAAGSA